MSANPDDIPQGKRRVAQDIMASSSSQYTDEHRRLAATQYAVLGNFSAVEREIGIPDSTLNAWAKTDWWGEIVGQIRESNQDQHITLYQRLTEKALAKAEEGIDSLTGDLSASDIKSLVVTGATATDKARLLLNQPTSIKADSESIKDLAAQFKALSESQKNIENTVVSEQ